MYISRLETLEDHKPEVGKTAWLEKNWDCLAYLQHVSNKSIIFS